MTAPTDGGDALTAVRDAAVERALLDAADARRYLALAGAIHRVHEEGVGSAGPLTAALTCTLAVSELRSTASRTPRDDSTGTRAHIASSPPTLSPAGPASPRSSVDATRELVATGAVLAVRRFDADPETVAARAGLPRADLNARLERET
ncbi:hypothetical protein [Halopelagius inordinatus]|uniref:hypothetical protein n=1 Tax=Halopelagius inordinatus TaxID=553467 RepID=UPI000B897442|nr:hypothetical protein [Halopelagius inordinatus]